MQNTTYTIVQAWQDAVNHKDEARLLALSSDNIEVVGPRGSAYGHQVLKDWLQRSGMKLQSLRAFSREYQVVVAQHATWTTPAGGADTEADMASHFVVRDGQVTQFTRYDSLDDALHASGLEYSDEVLTHLNS